MDEADAKLERYRAALDAGADPATIGAWIAEVRAERAEAERELLTAMPPTETTEDEIRALAAWFAEAADRFHRAMEAASPEARQALYDALQINARYTPGSSSIELSVAPSDEGAKRRVGGVSCTITPTRR